jgi:hypothetical protein
MECPLWLIKNGIREQAVIIMEQRYIKGNIYCGLLLEDKSQNDEPY